MNTHKNTCPDKLEPNLGENIMDREVWKKQKELVKQMKQNNPNWPTEKPKPHGSKQMSLGSLIKALKKERVGLPVILSSVYQGYTEEYPGLPHSYYGYPGDLAFVPETTKITVAQFLVICESAIQASFVGPDHSEDYYRDYIMKANTPVWISEINAASKNGIVDVVSTVDSISLIIKPIEEEEIKDGNKQE